MTASKLLRAGLFGLTSLALLPSSQAQSPTGEELFNDNCAACHVQLQAQDAKIPGEEVLRSLNANAILRTLTDGAMRLQGDLLTGCRFEIEAYNRLVSSEDRHEGVRAFNEKRLPDFKGR